MSTYKDQLAELERQQKILWILIIVVFSLLLSLYVGLLFDFDHQNRMKKQQDSSEMKKMKLVMSTERSKYNLWSNKKMS